MKERLKFYLLGFKFEMNYEIKQTRPTLIDRVQIFSLITFPAIWPFLIFFNENRNESYSVPRFFLYGLGTILIVFIGYFIFRYIFIKLLNSKRAATIYSIGVFSFFSYSFTYMFAYEFFAGSYLKTWAVFFVTMFIIAWFMSRTALFQKQVLIFGAVLVATPVIQYSSYYAELFFSTDLQFKLETTDTQINLSENSPSVYFIILDEYGRLDVLDEIYTFDNSKFIENLEERGFYVADQATSNYPYTIASLASTLSMNYQFIGTPPVQNIDNAQQSVYRGRGPVFDFFRNSGYEIAVLRWNGAECGDGYPDYCFSNAGIYFGDLERNLIKTTPFNSLIHVLFNDLLTPTYYELPDMNKSLKAIQNKQPLFAFIHALTPHTPHRFTSTCKQISVAEQLSNKNEYKGYVDQLKCANMQVLELITGILDRDPNSIIILQSDHGPKIGIDWNDLEQVNKNWSHSFSIINSWYFPKGVDCHKHLNPKLTSINTFRIIKSCLTDTEPDLLPNRWFATKFADQGSKKYSEIIPK